MVERLGAASVAFLLVISPCAWAAPPAPAAGGDSRVKLLVMDLTPGAGVDAAIASAVTESEVVAASSLGTFKITAPRDVQTLLGLERQKQVMGCGDDSSACVSELAGAMGTRFVLSGSLSRVGETYQLSLQMLDTAHAQNVGRSLRFARSLEDLRAQLPYQVAEATGAPPPKPPSKLLPYSMVGLGVAAVLSGAAVGLVTYSEAQVTAHELALGQGGDRAALQPVSTYAAEADRLKNQQVIAWTVGGAGLALIAGGLFWSFQQDTAAPAAKIALVPTGNGAALAGVWP